MEPEVSLSCPLEPATGPYPEPEESNPHPPISFPSNPFQYCPPIYAKVL
jgi:hypothetical protein